MSIGVIIILSYFVGLMIALGICILADGNVIAWPGSLNAVRRKNQRLKQKIRNRERKLEDLETKQRLLRQQNKLRAQLGMKVSDHNTVTDNIKRLERELEKDGVHWS